MDEQKEVFREFTKAYVQPTKANWPTANALVGACDTKVCTLHPHRSYQLWDDQSKLAHCSYQLWDDHCKCTLMSTCHCGCCHRQEHWRSHQPVVRRSQHAESSS